MLRFSFGMIMLLAPAAFSSGAEGNDKLPAPHFEASLVCFNGKADSGSSCRLMRMAKIEGGLTIINGKMTCGYKGAISEITWTYRGHKGSKDVYHVVRKFPSDTKEAKSKEVVVEFDGKRHVLFEDQSQYILIELQPTGK